MANPGPNGFPALFRAGDIGVSSEWRDITYDWAPILTADGVFIYSYLRDMFDNQRMLRPFILDPDGPTKQRIQRILGRRTGWAIQGPEYLLATVGLVHVEVQYGSSGDLDRPYHTAATYYVVGRLDHPVLDWTMLERVLNALMIALEPPSTDPSVTSRQKDAQAALRSLGQAGMLQNIDPEDLFDPDGAWPSLLPNLIQDARWIELFVRLHGVEALQPYRQQVRAWVEWAQRRAARLMQENRAIGDQLLAAQRRGPRGGGHNGTPPNPGGHAAPTEASTGTISAQRMTPANTSFVAFNQPLDYDVPAATEVNQIPPAVPEGLAMNQGRSELSLTSPQGLGVSERPLGTQPRSPHHAGAIQQSERVPDESLSRNQISLPCWGQESGNPEPGETVASAETLKQPETAVPPLGAAQKSEPEPDDIPLVAPHLCDDELSTTRQDGHFWQTVQQILHGDLQRYAYTEGEKKAAYRLFKRTETPVGVVLAALRAVMSLPQGQRPQRFGDALKLPVFHRCVQQALSLVRSRTAEDSATWPQFLQSYRSIGHASGLRDVSVPEYHVLKSLFEHQPNECWEVLQRAEQAAQPPQLSVAYLRRAISNNQQAAALRAIQPSDSKQACRRVPAQERARGVPAPAPEESLAPDPRRELLERENVNPAILTRAISVEQIQAWIAEADARQAEIKDRAAWLAWGIRSGRMPHDHPKLPPSHLLNQRSAASAQSPRATTTAHESIGQPADEQPPDIWQRALNHLRQQLPYGEFETWIKATSLIQVAEQQAIVGTPNIFARDKLTETYAPLIAETLHTLLGFPVQVAVVLDSRLAYA
ncbi:MAG TPA: DnaA N-terminal domain-containing protein [Herpetosiphonaceae bacterium]